MAVMLTQNSYMFISIFILIILLTLHACIFYSDSIKFNFLTKNTFKNIALLLTFIASFFFIVKLLAFIGFSVFESQLVVYITGGATSFYTTVCGWLYISSAFVYTTGQLLISILGIIIVALYYTVAFCDVELKRFICYSSCIFFSGLLLTATTNLIIMFFAYELILIPTSMVLDFFSKTSKSREAAFYMIIWTQIGAIFLFFMIIALFGIIDFFGASYYTITASKTTVNIANLVLLFGFGTKMPIWPFYWWLPEAHVEVSTNFSIILSGVSIKFAFVAYMRFVELLTCGDVYWVIFICAFIGLIDAALRIDGESDIKKVVAFQTVVEMHLAVCFIGLDQNAFFDLILFLLQTHGWISTISFIIVDFIMKRYHSRNIEHLCGIFAESPRIVKFIFFIVFILGSIPGTALYTLEFLVQAHATTIPLNFVFFLIVQFFVVIWSRNIWWTIWGGDVLNHATEQPFNLTKCELTFLLILVLQLIPTLFYIDGSISLT